MIRKVAAYRFVTRKHNEAIMVKIRRRRWLTMLLNPDGSVQEPYFWLTKTGASAGLRRHMKEMK